MFSKEDKSLILNSIKKHYKLKNNVEFAAFLGISPQNLSNWYSRGTLDFELLYTKCVNISGDWLLSLKGDMVFNNIVSEPAVSYTKTCSRCADKDKLIESLERSIRLLEEIDEDQKIKLAKYEKSPEGKKEHSKQTG